MIMMDPLKVEYNLELEIDGVCVVNSRLVGV